MPQGIYSKIQCHVGDHPKFTPQEHQKKVLDYFLNKSKYKGLLLYHRLGSGKSCSSILISDQMINQAKTKKIFVLTPGSLRQNFIEEYCEKCGKSPKYLKKYYTFITTNYAVGKNLPDFNDSFVIIDEVHNLINGVKNQSTHPTLIYKKLLKSNCRVLALTGTPIFNYYWEWPLLGNLLKPGEFPSIFKEGKVEPESFTKLFDVDNDGIITAKPNVGFDIQLRGIISYFPGVAGGFYPEVIQEPPIKVEMTPVQQESYITISEKENEIRGRGPPDKEKYSNKDYIKYFGIYIMALKYIMSRKVSNFYYDKFDKDLDEIEHIGTFKKYYYKPDKDPFEGHKETFNNFFYPSKKQELQNKYPDMKPDDIVSQIFISWNNMTKKERKPFFTQLKKLKDEEGKEGKEETLESYNSKEELLHRYPGAKEKNIIEEIKENVKIGWITRDRFKNNLLTDLYSRKFTALLTNIIINWKAKHVVFSFFKTKSGVNLIHALFKMCGIKTVIYSGDISDNERKIILKKFNAEDNRYGDKIKILLLTEAGAEGINILEAQHMHILESSTREMKIQQAIGRVVRYKSHMVDGRKPMPKNEQVVHIWRYWSVLNETVNKLSCVDEILYEDGRKTVNNIQSFLRILKNASVTSYDKSYDKDSFMPDYRGLKISEKLKTAFNNSDERCPKKTVFSQIDYMYLENIGDDDDDEVKDLKNKLFKTKKSKKTEKVTRKQDNSKCKSDDECLSDNCVNGKCKSYDYDNEED